MNLLNNGKRTAVYAAVVAVIHVSREDFMDTCNRMTHEEMAQVLESLAARARIEQEEAEREGRTGAAEKHAARLREYAADPTIHPQEREDLIAGADALEFKAWLFEPNPRGVLRMFTLWYGWHQQGDFLAYCEARFKESKAPSKTPKESTT